MVPIANIKSISYLKTHAAMKIMALGEKDRLQGKGFSVAESRAQLAAARQRRKQVP